MDFAIQSDVSWHNIECADSELENKSGENFMSFKYSASIVITGQEAESCELLL